MEWYWEIRVVLVSTLKKDATSSSLVTHVVKADQVEDVLVLDVGGTFPDEHKEKITTLASTSMASLIFSLSRYVQAMHVALASLEASVISDHLQEFHFHSKEKYGGLRWDQM